MRVEFLTKVDEVHKLREEIAYIRCAPQEGGAYTNVKIENPAARVCWTDDTAHEESSWKFSRQISKLAILQLASIGNDARSSACNSNTRNSAHKSL
jgi:hypothetical protein